MLELAIYGLMGLPAMVFIAGWFAYADEFSSPREKSSFNRIKDGRLNDSQMIETGTGNPRFRGDGWWAWLTQLS
jgi:hypothetical protein